MLDQVLWIDFLLKLAAGVSLLLAPDTLALGLGLPRVVAGFYARLLGAVLIGIALAILAEGLRRQGLGATGAFLINLTGASALALQLALVRPALPRRGRLLVSACALVLALLGASELVLA